MVDRTPDQEALEKYISGLADERDAFLKLHAQIVAAHPDWLRRQDARTNLLAKPINLILIAIVNLRLSQNVLSYVEFWHQQINDALTTPDSAAAALFEQGTFYRFGFFQFLMSNIEHGFRAIYPQVVDGTEEHVFAQIYKNLFQAVLSKEIAATHTSTFDFLRLLRNTIHNNSVFYPQNRKNMKFNIAGREYILTVGRQANCFGWEQLIEWLPSIREAIADVLNAPSVVAIEHISDMANST